MSVESFHQTFEGFRIAARHSGKAIIEAIGGMKRLNTALNEINKFLERQRKTRRKYKRKGGKVQR